MDSSPLRPRVLATLSENRRFEGHSKRLAAFLDLEPARIRELFRRLDSANAWIELFPGVSEQRFAAGNKRSTARCSVVRVAASARFATLASEDESWVFILDGFGVEGRRAWLPGDLLHLAMGPRSVVASEHAPLLFVRVAFVRSARP